MSLKAAALGTGHLISSLLRAWQHMRCTSICLLHTCTMQWQMESTSERGKRLPTWCVCPMRLLRLPHKTPALHHASSRHYQTAGVRRGNNFYYLTRAFESVKLSSMAMPDSLGATKRTIKIWDVSSPWHRLDHKQACWVFKAYVMHARDAWQHVPVSAELLYTRKDQMAAAPTRWTHPRGLPALPHLTPSLQAACIRDRVAAIRRAQRLCYRLA